MIPVNVVPQLSKPEIENLFLQKAPDVNSGTQSDFASQLLKVTEGQKKPVAEKDILGEEFAQVKAESLQNRDEAAKHGDESGQVHAESGQALPDPTLLVGQSRLPPQSVNPTHAKDSNDQVQKPVVPRGLAQLSHGEQRFASGAKNELASVAVPEGYESLLAANPVETELAELSMPVEFEEGIPLSDLKVDPRLKVHSIEAQVPLDSKRLASIENSHSSKAPVALDALKQGSLKIQGLPDRVSTQDFLSLRGLRKEKTTSHSNPGLEGASLEQASKQPLHLGPVLDAPVTQGTAGKPILSHDAIHQISHQVNILGQARKDGEIKIRLKPDHLGELMLSVKSKGNEVSIQIRTHDPEAKKIIEDSLGRLKESLSVQNLNLSKMDVITQAAPPQASEIPWQMDLGQNSGGFDRGGSRDWSESQRETRQEFLYDELPVSSNLKSIGSARSGRVAGAGNLDLIA